jgi:uncharacterized protein YdaL
MNIALQAVSLTIQNQKTFKVIKRSRQNFKPIQYQNPTSSNIKYKEVSSYFQSIFHNIKNKSQFSQLKPFNPNTSASQLNFKNPSKKQKTFSTPRVSGFLCFITCCYIFYNNKSNPSFSSVKNRNSENLKFLKLKILKIFSSSNCLSFNPGS